MFSDEPFPLDLEIVESPYKIYISVESSDRIWHQRACNSWRIQFNFVDLLFGIYLMGAVTNRHPYTHSSYHYFTAFLVFKGHFLYLKTSKQVYLLDEHHKSPCDYNYEKNMNV